MKKLILIALILLQYNIYAQKENYASIYGGADVKNLFFGSPPTNNVPSPDILIGLNMVGDNLLLNPEVEIFNKIGFRRESLSLGYVSQRYIPINGTDLNFNIIPSLGISAIHRYGQDDKKIETPTETYFIYGHSTHIALQANLSITVKITNKIMLDYTLQCLQRPDLKYLYPTDPNKKYVFSGFLKLHYILTN